MVKWSQRQWTDLLWLANGLVLAVVINQLASLYFFRMDLTEEKRFSIKPQTRALLESLEDDVYVEVYLEGDLNAGFRRLRKGVRETLEEFRIYSGNKVHYVFTDPAAAAGQKAQREFMAALAQKGIQPMNVIENHNGQRTEKLVFPGALVSSGGGETGIMLLKGNRAENSQEVLNQSIEGVEFELASAIHRLTSVERRRVGWLTGHGESEDARSVSVRRSMQESFDLMPVNLSDGSLLAPYDVIVVAKPTRSFSEADKYRLDQYLMKGGRMLWLVDELEVNMDSVSNDNYFAFPYRLNLDDQFFKYGVRINMDLVQDRVSLLCPVMTGMAGGKPQMTPMEWPFYPMINHYADHPVTRNMDAAALRFASSIDTVKAPGVKKTPLLMTSPYARKIMAPVRVSVNDLRKELKPENYQSGPIALGYLLEGKFTSLYRNRFAPAGTDTTGFSKESVPTRMIVIADGDLVRNEINPRSGQPQALGFDAFSGRTFANQDVVLNMVSWLADESGLINVRTKEVMIRPLDKEKVRTERMFWQVLNVGGPVVLILLLGLIKSFVRKRRYTHFNTAS